MKYLIVVAINTKITTITVKRKKQVLIVLVGVGTYAFAVGSSKLPNTLMGMLAAITMNIGAPFFGCCLAGMTIPFMNRKGAIAGLFSPIIPIGLQISSGFVETQCNAESRMMVEHSHVNFTRQIDVIEGADF